MDTPFRPGSSNPSDYGVLPEWRSQIHPELLQISVTFRAAFPKRAQGNPFRIQWAKSSSLRHGPWIWQRIRTQKSNQTYASNPFRFWWPFRIEKLKSCRSPSDSVTRQRNRTRRRIRFRSPEFVLGLDWTFNIDLPEFDLGLELDLSSDPWRFIEKLRQNPLKLAV